MKRLAFLLAFAQSAVASSIHHDLPPGFQEVTEIGGTWDGAVGLLFGPDDRMYVWEKAGRVWIVDQAGNRLSEPLIDLSDEVGNWRDLGLLGFALDPNFLNNGYLYLTYVVDHHHLEHFGTPQYDPMEDDYFRATIARLTRYRADPATGLSTVFPTSRVVLVGETPDSGIPILHQSHGSGQILFANDGTLLVACGEGASSTGPDTGGPGDGGPHGGTGSYAVQALAEGILLPKEDVGAFRSQLLDCLGGKILRLDPQSGDGVPSNPFFDPLAPRAPRSRVWALGLRNPYRMALRPGTGGHHPEEGDPGTLYIGDVGWGFWEELNICDGPGQNFGWPAFEGHTFNAEYWMEGTDNLDAPNPLYGHVVGPGPCAEQYFKFQNLIIQEIDGALPPLPNPCDPAQNIPSGIETWMHRRPAIDWVHGQDPRARLPVFTGGAAETVDLGDPSCPVEGEPFSGDCSVGGVWYTASDFPPEYTGVYYHADFAGDWIRLLRFDAADALIAVEPMLELEEGSIVHLATHPTQGGLYYILYGAEIRKIVYAPSGNQPPVAVASLDVAYGNSPLTVQFTGDASSDPEDSRLTYLWDFGGATSAEANPQHVFNPGPGSPARFDVTLTVTDQGGLIDTADLIVSVNNTPPTVAITSPVDGTLYPLSGDTIYNLTADVTDLEHSGSELACAWQTILHHNDHTHPEPVDPSCATTSVVSPLGCDGQSYSYEIVLTVTDAAGLSASDSAMLYPDCPNEPPLALDDLASAPQGHASDVDVLYNDVDLDGSIDPSSLIITLQPEHGSAVPDPVLGVVTYVHDATPSATDSFRYRVEDDEGALSNEATVQLSCFNNPPSVAIDSPVPAETYTVGQPIVLRATGSDPEDGSDVTYHWHIDRLHNESRIEDVFTWEGPKPPDFIVPRAGLPGDRISYLVTVIAADIMGATAQASRVVAPLVPPPNAAPLAAFEATPRTGQAPLEVILDASDSSDGDGDYLLHEWTLDGITAQGPLLPHTFETNGSHLVLLRVTDSAGASSEVGRTIVVKLHGPTPKSSPPVHRP
jgi:PKD repeat protein/glucose/arabinose dehydrogenase